MTGSATAAVWDAFELCGGGKKFQFRGIKEDHFNVPLLSMQIPVFHRESARRLVSEGYLFAACLAANTAVLVLVPGWLRVNCFAGICSLGWRIAA